MHKIELCIDKEREGEKGRENEILTFKSSSSSLSPIKGGGECSSSDSTKSGRDSYEQVDQ